MCWSTRMLCIALFLCSLHYSSSNTIDLKKIKFLGGNDINDGVDRAAAPSQRAYDYDYDDGLELSVGAIIGIGIAVIVLLCGVPILCCFCCACCCFSNRRNKSTVVVAPMPQYMPQQYSNAAVQQQNVTVTNHTNGPPAYDPNQNGYRDNIGFSVYPGSSSNLHATQSTNQYYNYNNGAPPPNPRFSTNKQTHNYEQQPPYFNVAAQYSEQYQPPRSK